MPQDQKSIQQPERDRGDHEQIRRRDAVRVISQKRLPSLGGRTPYTGSLKLSLSGEFPDAREFDSTWRTQEVRHVGSDTIAPRFWCVSAAWFAGMIESGPIPAVHGVVRWRLIDLAQWIFEEFRITIAKQTLSRELRAMGYRKLSARPRHYAQAAGAIEDFKKASPRAWTKSRGRRRSASTR